MTTSVLTGTFTNPDGSPKKGVKVLFHLSTHDITSTLKVSVADPVYTTTDQNGYFTANLWSNEAVLGSTGIANTYYEIAIEQGGLTDKIGWFILPDKANSKLADILNLYYTDTPSGGTPSDPPTPPGSVDWDDIENKPTEYPPEAHRHLWGEIDGKPIAYPPEDHLHDWGDIQDKPTEYPPQAHLHSEEDIQDLDKYTQAEVDASQATQDSRLLAIESAGLATERVRWLGDWVPGQYEKFDMLRDGDWTMIANKLTGDRPSPQPYGESELIYGDPSFVTGSFTGEVRSGLDFTVTEDGTVTGISIWVPEVNSDKHFALITVEDPGGTPIITRQTISSTALTANEWSLVAPSGLGLVRAGVRYQIYLESHDYTQSTTTEAGYNEGSSNNDPEDEPTIGQWLRDSHNMYNFHRIDRDGQDQTTMLRSLTVGDTFSVVQDNNPANRWVYEIIDPPIEFTNHFSMLVTRTLSAGNPTNGTYTRCYFDVIIDLPTEFSEEVNRWITQPGFANVNGILMFDSVSQPINPNNGYGIDFTFQPYNFSEDWDVVATSGQQTPTSSLPPIGSHVYVNSLEDLQHDEDKAYLSGDTVYVWDGAVSIGDRVFEAVGSGPITIFGTNDIRDKIISSSGGILFDFNARDLSVTGVGFDAPSATLVGLTRSSGFSFVYFEDCSIDEINNIGHVRDVNAFEWRGRCFITKVNGSGLSFAGVCDVIGVEGWICNEWNDWLIDISGQARKVRLQGVDLKLSNVNQSLLSAGTTNASITQEGGGRINLTAIRNSPDEPMSDTDFNATALGCFGGVTPSDQKWDLSDDNDFIVKTLYFMSGRITEDHNITITDQWTSLLDAIEQSGQFEGSLFTYSAGTDELIFNGEHVKSMRSALSWSSVNVARQDRDLTVRLSVESPIKGTTQTEESTARTKGREFFSYITERMIVLYPGDKIRVEIKAETGLTVDLVIHQMSAMIS